MGSSTQLVGWLESRLARALASRSATPVILAGTMAFAGLGAAAMNTTKVHQAPSPAVRASVLTLTSPRTFCYPDPDGDGHTICHILESQISTVPNMGCYADPDGDGTFICYFASDPAAAK
jgi:hypothetical protein